MAACINERVLRTDRVLLEICGLHERACGLFDQVQAEVDAIKGLQKEIEERKARRDSLWDQAIEITGRANTATRIFLGSIPTGTATQAGKKDK